MIAENSIHLLLAVGMCFETKQGRIFIVDNDLDPPHERVTKGFYTGEVGEGFFRFWMSERMINTVPVRVAVQ